ncbi:ribosomal protein [Hirsutella rhossiliensis]|uniref:Ribosomal protein s9/S16 n=1 Tax=Hirsutella rhossiliensis TaxID=111463 RepID=A0A9P8MZK9_9HYPO|nr:ribosomal protein s9/S16 [Hirsutella rhossiliensis]KAH0964948.1 ribosomal protein s9/S16 [Hirsutella rhossiliensis]
MASFTSNFRHLRCQRQWMSVQWHQIALPLSSPVIRARAISTKPSVEESAAEAESLAESVKIPFQDVKYARCVPATPSYFSREPQFNDLYIRISNLLARYRHLPIVKNHEAPLVPWTKLEELRAQLEEPIKASQYAMVIRIAKRLNLIVPTLMPDEVQIALQRFTRNINPFLNRPRPIKLDKFGRAVGAGKRKESTARAFVVEGSGEVLVNGKTLDQAFGRVYDRESAVWALTSTRRLDKYNVWALVEGGGTTGQSQALAQAIAKALVAHEPALKPALRKGESEGRGIRISALRVSDAYRGPS